MTLPFATAALLASLGVLVALLAPQAPRLLRHGGLPARPRRVWVTLLVAREIGTAGAATAAAWLALAAPGPLPAWAAAALAGAAAFLVAEGLAPALGLRPVRAVMTPRVRIAVLPVDIGGAALLAALREQRFSRVPVYRGERDNVVGVLYAKDLLGRDASAPGFRLEPFLRPPTFVPLGMRAGDVFRELRRRKVHLALVVDEYGGIAGLVTMEDLLEELFGEIRDEYDEAEAT